VAISADGQYIVAGSVDNNVYLFNRSCSALLWKKQTNGDVFSVAISSDGQYIAAGSNDYNIYFFNMTSSFPLWSYTTSGNVRSVAISSDSQYIVAGNNDNYIYLFHFTYSPLILDPCLILSILLSTKPPQFNIFTILLVNLSFIGIIVAIIIIFIRIKKRG